MPTPRLNSYSHIRAHVAASTPRPRTASSPRGRGDADYFNRPVSFSHVHARYPGPALGRAPAAVARALPAEHVAG